MNEEDVASLAHIQSIHQRLIQEQKYQNWKDVLEILFPIYLHLKNLTANWTLQPALDDHSGLLCNCPLGTQTVREVDLIDLMGLLFCQYYSWLKNCCSYLLTKNHVFLGQKRVNFKFCSCTPDPALLLANGYLSSTPIFPQTAFSVQLLNFYDLLWNLRNAHTAPFAKVLQRWNESMSKRLCAKNSTKASPE
jgi:hypothetical protein